MMKSKINEFFPVILNGLTGFGILLICFKVKLLFPILKGTMKLFGLFIVYFGITVDTWIEDLFCITMVPFKTVGIKKLLGIPDEYEAAAFIPIGYPKKEPEVRQIKINLEERIHIDKW